MFGLLPPQAHKSLAGLQEAFEKNPSQIIAEHNLRVIFDCWLANHLGNICRTIKANKRGLMAVIMAQKGH